MKRHKCSLEVIVLRGVLDETIESGDHTTSSRDDTKTCLDLVVTKDMTFETIHNTITSLLSLQKKAEQLQYYLETDKRDIPQEDFFYTLSDLKINDGDRIIIDIAKRNKRKRNSDLYADDENSGEEEDTLEFVCTTRIFEAEGVPVRRTRVYVKRHHPCSYLMDDISTLWNRGNLKFRCGRITLVPEKTFAELGIKKTENEILVTGGRS